MAAVRMRTVVVMSFAVRLVNNGMIQPEQLLRTLGGVMSRLR